MKTKRTFTLAGSGLAVAALLLATDPDVSWIKLPFGMATASALLGLLTPFLVLWLAHLARKWLHPYVDLEQAWRTSLGHPVGAGLAAVAGAIIVSALLGLFGRPARASEIPPQALPYLPMLSAEVQTHWPGHPLPSYFGGLIEHETGPCPQGRQCWKPTARLKTAREEGAGFAQITRTWTSDGRTRFDALAEMRQAHPALQELDWSNVYQRPDLQLRVLVLKSRGDWRWLGQPAAMEFVDLAYNAGRGRVLQDRRACGMTAGCDPAQWAGHVERTCTASRAPIYGTRSACDISRHHVADVMCRAQHYRGVI